LAVKRTPEMAFAWPVGAWLPGIHWGVREVDLGVVELARGLGEVGGDPDGGLLGEDGDAECKEDAGSGATAEQVHEGSFQEWLTTVNFIP
jgi:hypothetical protein